MGDAIIPSCTLLVAVALAASVSFGWTIQVSSMPVSPHTDTEVSTNIPVNKADIGYSDLNFRLNGPPTTALSWLSELTRTRTGFWRRN